jgi:hypothetical protein
LTEKRFRINDKTNLAKTCAIFVACPNVVFGTVRVLPLLLKNVTVSIPKTPLELPLP